MATTHSLVLAAATAAAPPPPSQKNKTIKHEIFLSHSGKQKGFAKDLAARLSSEGYTVFFDQNNDSLPPGEDFPSHIVYAAHACKLALVLVCEGYVTSRWPLMELCSFVDRRVSVSTFTILPLFFKLSAEDLKEHENVRKWHKEWKRFERENTRISAAKCEEAVTKVLPRLNGVNRRHESEQGEGSYIDDIIKRIYSIMPPRVLSMHRYGAGPDKQYVGMERLCQIILDKFSELEDPHSDLDCDGNISNCCILGMHGVSGSGKSTLCNFLCNFMFDEFMGKVIHLELPTELRGDDDPSIVKHYVRLLSTISPHRMDAFASMDLVQLYNLLLAMETQFNHKMFLVLDNISPSNYGSSERIVKAILRSDVLGSGSRVMLVAQSSVILENLLKEVEHRYRYAITEIPCLTKEEAMEVIRQNRYPSAEEDVISHLLDKCSFPSSSFMYVPFVFEQIGILLRKRCRTEYLKELELLSKMVDECKKEAIQELVEINFKRLPKDLQVLLFDIALFMIPAGYSKLRDLTPVLCRMHDMTDIDAFKLQWKIKELMEHCALSVTDYGELRVHDIYVEYAEAVPGNSKSYVDEPSLNYSDAPTMFPIRLHRMEYRDARTIYINSGGHYDEEMCLHVDVAVTTRALVLRNSRQYCKCILVLSGDLSSLVCVRAENVQVSLLSPARSYHPLSNLVRVEIMHENLKDRCPMKASNSQHGRWVSSVFNFVSDQIQNSVILVRWLRMANFPWDQYFATNSQRLSKGFGFSTQMTCLRVLILKNAGIAQLEIAGRSFPLLEDVKVYSRVQEPIDISIDNPPNLKWLAARESSNSYHYNYKPRRSVRILGHYCSRQSRTLTLQLGECLELEQLQVDGSFDEVKVVGLLPSSLRDLRLGSDRSLRFKPSELIWSCIHQLSLLQTLELSCKKVERMNFTRQCFGCLPCLEKMCLTSCDSLTHISMGPECMPNLVVLDVSFCCKLQAFEGVEHLLLMEQLEMLCLAFLPQLQVECEARSGNYNLKEIQVVGCPGMNIEVIQRMKGIPINELGMCRTQDDNVDDEARENCANADDESMELMLASSTTVALDRVWYLDGPLTGLWSARIDGRFTRSSDDVRGVSGLQNFPDLRHVYLSDLPRLARVWDTWPTRIKSIRFASCPMLQVIPPLEQTPHLQSLSCVGCTRLKRVEGRFREMKELCSVEFVECESMEVFPMEDMMEEMGKTCQGYGEYEWAHPLKVYGSKFASMELMQTWLQNTEIGSPLWKAAVEVLILQGAVDVLADYLSALADNITEAGRRYLSNPPVLMGHWQFNKSRWVYAKKPEVNLLVERLLLQFPQLRRSQK